MKLWYGGAGTLGLILLGVAAWLWDPLPSNPSSQRLAAGADTYDVEILRDDWGVPHIFGETRADTAFGLAYAHAEDDFETIQETVAATRGDLASYRGAAAAPTDYIVALLEVWETVGRRYDSDVPADVKATAEAYAAGLNLYASEHPEATWTGLAPFTGRDVVAGFIFKTPFFYGLDSVLLDLFGEGREAELAMDPGPGREAWLVAPKSHAERGSNAMAVAPARGGDGVTRLLINSHQPLTGPVAWYEAHTVSADGLDMTGGLFPGTPLVLHGFNRDLGWANTVSEPDLVDIYRLERNPDNKWQYRFDGEWRDFERSSVEIKVRLAGPFAFRAKRPLLRTVHGPVVEAEHGTYAVRYAGMGEIRQLEQYYRLNTARTLEDFETVMSMLALPSINYVYADRDGNIGFFHNGQYPDRAPGWDWQKDLPGDRAELVWQGYLPWSGVPKLVNPRSGFVYNSNNSPFTATDGPDNLSPDDFPASMGLQTNQTNRALRMRELADGQAPIGRDTLLGMKFDTAYAEGSIARRVVAEVLAGDWSGDATLSAAAAHLAAWDFSAPIDSRHAALGVLTVTEAITEKYTGRPAPSPEDAFRAAAAHLDEHFGRIDPEWGEVNRLVRGDISLPISGAADTLRAVYPAALDDGPTLRMVAGDTWISLVEWDADGTLRADVIHPFGSATLDAGSRHYADQAPLFAAGQWRPALLERRDIEAVATRVYRPGQPD